MSRMIRQLATASCRLKAHQKYWLQEAMESSAFHDKIRIKNKHSAPFSSERVSSVAASRSIKFELIVICQLVYAHFKIGGAGTSHPFA